MWTIIDTFKSFCLKYTKLGRKRIIMRITSRRIKWDSVKFSRHTVEIRVTVDNPFLTGEKGLPHNNVRRKGNLTRTLQLE